MCYSTYSQHFDIQLKCAMYSPRHMPVIDVYKCIYFIANETLLKMSLWISFPRNISVRNEQFPGSAKF